MNATLPLFATPPTASEFDTAIRRAYGVPVNQRPTQGLLDFAREQAMAQAAKEWADNAARVRAGFTNEASYIAVRWRELCGLHTTQHE